MGELLLVELDAEDDVPEESLMLDVVADVPGCDDKGKLPLCALERPEPVSWTGVFVGVDADLALNAPPPRDEYGARLPLGGNGGYDA